MGQYRLSGPARQDLAELWDNIAPHNLAAADRIIDAIIARCSILAEYPRLGTARDNLRPGFRSFPVGNYMLFYKAVPDGVEILRVFYGGRDIEQLFGK